MSIQKKHWGSVDNKPVSLYTLQSRNGIIVKITNYGGIITSILTPDKSGKMGDIVLGYDHLEGYLVTTPYFGAIVGRYANRIAKGTFCLDNRRFNLTINDGNNSLHGGLKGFDKVVWDAHEFDAFSAQGIVLTYHSRDREEGYPGNLDVKVTYLLNEDEFNIAFEAETDKPTPVNLCNHTYFNLREAESAVLGHRLRINAHQYTPVNAEFIPTGKLQEVNMTPLDFTDFHTIGERICQVEGGYDHNFILSKRAREMTLAATVQEPLTGREVSVFTTQPGIQFYTGNFLDGSIVGKDGKIYARHYGLCLETQHFPDSPNQPAFPNTILRPGESYREVTSYRFSVQKDSL